MDRAITTESKDSEKSKNCSQMSTSGSSPVPSRYIHTDKAGEKPRQFNTVAGLLGFLHDHVDSQIYTMPDAELEWFAGARDNAALMTDNLGETIGNIAALVGHEVNFDHKEPTSGALQPSGLEQFLYHASDTIVTIGAMTEIAGTAAWALRDRWEQRARALGFKHSDSEENGNG